MLLGGQSLEDSREWVAANTDADAAVEAVAHA